MDAHVLRGDLERPTALPPEFPDPLTEPRRFPPECSLSPGVLENLRGTVPMAGWGGGHVSCVGGAARPLNYSYAAMRPFAFRLD